jgi:hypothetical protein
MKTTNGNGNGKAGRFTTEVIDANPYLQRPSVDKTPKPLSGEQDPFEAPIDHDDETAAVETEERQSKVTRRRRFALAGVAAVFLIAIISALVLYFGGSTRVEYGRRPRTVMPPPPNGTTTSGRDTRTDQAIEEAQRLTSGSDQNTSVTATPPKPLSTQAPQTAEQRPDNPFTVPATTGLGATVNTQPNDLQTRTNTETSFDIQSGPGTIPATNGAPGASRTNRSQRSSETSLYMTDPSDHRAEPGPNSTRQPNIKPLPMLESNAKGAVLPAFASMLPVRTIGALYSLRRGALVRLELTRDARGSGWSMKRGTTLVGTTKGSDLDRAYVTILGFIDPQTGRLVKLGGEVRGGDGGEGLKGKRRQLDSGWVRALGRVSGAALDVAGALLSGRGRDTVVISDGLRTRAINPVTDEVSGVLGGELNRRQERGFVEVVAGTPGYVMVTDLPAIIRGTEATPELDDQTLALLTDVDVARPATGLSEHELAELLANGSPEEIRAAMPRMTSEMRKIATAVLPP